MVVDSLHGADRRESGRCIPIPAGMARRLPDSLAALL